MLSATVMHRAEHWTPSTHASQELGAVQNKDVTAELYYTNLEVSCVKKE